MYVCKQCNFIQVSGAEEENSEDADHETYVEFLLRDSRMELVLARSDGGSGVELAVGLTQRLFEAIVELALQDSILGDIFMGCGVLHKCFGRHVSEILENRLDSIGNLGIQVAQNLLAVIGSLDTLIFVRLVAATSFGTAAASLGSGGALARIFLGDASTCTLLKGTDLAFGRAGC
jgi:hypothetical protein